MMKPVGRRGKTACAAVLFLSQAMILPACAPKVVYRPSPPAVKSGTAMTIPEAMEKVRVGLKLASSSYVGNCRYTYQDVNVTVTGFSYTRTSNCPSRPMKFASYKYRELAEMELIHWSGAGPGYHTNLPVQILWTNSNYAAARDFMDGVEALRRYASGADLADDAPAFAAFREQARTWRSLPAKPPLPEEVRRSQLLAEDAIRSKDFETAINHYEQGINASPLWPEGQFNAALLYGELGLYGRAVSRMKRYLELRPDAPDAQAARDQVTIWQAKISAPVPSLSLPAYPYPD